MDETEKCIPEASIFGCEFVETKRTFLKLPYVYKY